MSTLRVLTHSLRNRVTTTTAVVGVLSAITAGAAGAAAMASGNQAAIRFYGHSQTAMAAYQGIAFAGHGTSYRILHEPGYDNFDFDFGTVPHGYKRSRDSTVVVQRQGRVNQEVDTLKAKGLPSVTLYRLDTGLLIGKVNDAKGCPVTFNAPGVGFASVGSPFVVLSGHRFAALRHTSAGVLVTSSYASSGGRGQETDTIGSDHLFKASSYVQRTGPYKGYRLSESGFHYRRSHATFAAPQLGRC